jgi:regulator of protease activity HflC (stomatin/prohibitin superfamily)
MLRQVIIGTSSVFVCISLISCTKVPAGHKGVIVNLYGSDKGVSEETVGVGRYYLGWNKELYLFPVFLQNYTWAGEEQITMQTSEGLSISADVGVTYNIHPENVSKVFQKYRLGIDEITHTFLHNMVRDAMNQVSSTMTVEQLYGDKKEQFIVKVNDIVKKECLEVGIDMDKIYLIGSFKLPDNVVESINAKIQASQNAMKVENEVATAKAEALKTVVVAEAEAQRILIDAKARAESNRLLSESLTTSFIQYQTLLKWDGKLPQITGSSTIPMINLKSN